MFDNKWQKKEMPLVSLIGMGGGIASPAFLASIVLNILKPTVFSPADDAGVPDFDYTAESSAITSIDQVVSNVPVVGPDENFNGGTLYAQRLHSVYDPSTQRIVIAYTDWSNNEYGTYVVGQVDGDSITFGTPATFRNSKCINIKTGYDPVNEKVYIAFVNGGNGSNVAVVAGDVDPTTNSINFGNYINLNGKGGGILGMAYDTTNQKMVVAYHDDTVHKGKVECVTMRDASSNLLGNGPQAEFGSGIVDNISNNGGISSNIVYDPNTNRIVIAYSGNDDYDGKVVVGEGTGGGWNTATVNFGSPVRFDNLGNYSGITYGDSKRIRIVYNPDAQKIIIGYRLQYSFDNQNYISNAQVIAGTVDPSTNTVNFGNSTVFGDLDPRELEIDYDSNSQKMILAYHPYIGGETNRIDFVTATIDGTTISVEDPVNIGTYSAIPYNTSIAYDSSNQKFVVSHTTNATGGISNVVSLTSTATQLTLTDTTVSKVSDGTLIEGVSIDEVLTSGETVRSDVQTNVGWITTMGNVSSNEAWDVKVDSSGNVYVVGSDSNPYSGGAVAKLNSSSEIQWSRYSHGGAWASQVLFYAVHVDGSGNVYAGGKGEPSHNALLYKYNSSGVLQWKKELNASSSYEYINGITEDSSGNIYVSAYLGGKPGVVKLNPSGNVIWSSRYDRSGQPFGVALDSSDNAYLVGDIDSKILLVKFNSSGHHAWARTLGNSQHSQRGYDVAVDSSNDIFVVGRSHYGSTYSGDYDSILAKYSNSDGSLLWQRKIGNSGMDSYYDGIAIDDSDNVYLSIMHTGQTLTAVKYDNDGNIQWQNTLNTTGTEYNKNIAVDPDGTSIYMVGHCDFSGAGTEWVVAKLPGDGTGTGTYDTFTYSTSDLTDEVASLTHEEIGWGGESFSVTVTDSTYEEADATMSTSGVRNILGSLTATISASTGNTITLSNTTGTWSTGMKVQGTDPDTKDYPDAIRIEDVSLTSSAPTAEKNVNTWGDAVWEIATDENFTQNVQTATTALSATGTQAGPSFTLERETGYYTRTKYTALGQESEWSDVTYFVTRALYVDSFWINLLSPNGWDNEYTEGLDSDDNGNVYVISIRYSAGGSGYKGMSLVKLDPNGDIQWQKYMTYNIPGDRTYPLESRTVSVTPDGSEIFVTAQGDLGMLVCKFNSDGDLQWTKKLGGVNSNNFSYGTTLTSSGELVMFGRDYENPGSHTFVTQISNTGSQTFYSSIGRTNGDTMELAYECEPFADSDDNIHFVINSWNGSKRTPGVVKYNSSGVLQSVSDFNSTVDTSIADEDHFADIAVDGSGNKYVTYRRDVSSTHVSGMRSGLLKLNSSDEIQWQSDVSSNNQIYPLQVNIDSSGDIVSAFQDRRTNSAIIITKHTSDGTLVWKRTFRHSNTEINPNAEVRLNRNDNIILNSFTYGTVKTIVCQLPSTGDLTGTYGNFIWEDATDVTVSSSTAYFKNGSSIYSAKSTSMSMSSFSNTTTGDNILTVNKTDIPTP